MCTVHCVLCTEIEHIVGCISERCTVHRHNTFHTEHQKCVLCSETEHFPDRSPKNSEFTDHKTTLKNETQPFTFTPIYQHMQLTHNKSHYELHTAGTALCIAFSLCYVHMLLLRMLADGMQVIYNIKCGIYSFIVCHNLSFGFLRHCAQ